MTANNNSETAAATETKTRLFQVSGYLEAPVEWFVWAESEEAVQEFIEGDTCGRVDWILSDRWSIDTIELDDDMGFGTVGIVHAYDSNTFEPDEITEVNPEDYGDSLDWDKRQKEERRQRKSAAGRKSWATRRSASSNGSK